MSTNDQKTDMQLADLRKFAKDRGLTIFNEYIDNGVSGSIKSRPALDKLMADAKKNKIDVVLVLALRPLCKVFKAPCGSVTHLQAFWNRLHIVQ